MTTDDLDFFLLDIVSTGILGLTVFEIPNLDVCLGRAVPSHTRPELVAALAELFSRGDIEATAEGRRGRSYSHLCLNPEEIEAGIAGAIPLSYRLTPQGGERWRRHAGVDWQCWDGDRWINQITTANRELTEFLFQRDLRSGVVSGKPHWRVVRPWKATYWHEEPVGYRVRYRADHGSFDGRVFPFGWAYRSLRPGFQPEVLAARRLRTSTSVPPVCVCADLSEVQLSRRALGASPLSGLSAASEMVRRTDSAEKLAMLLLSRSPVLRYCAARAMGERKMHEAVPALVGAVCSTHDVAAVQALGQLADERALEPLLFLWMWWRGHADFSDPPFFVALEAAILQFGKAAIERVEVLLRESRVSPERALELLIRSKAPEVVPILLCHMREHYGLMKVLARFGDEARACLFAVADNSQESGSHRWQAARALAEIEGVFQAEGRQMLQAFRTSSHARRIEYFLSSDASTPCLAGPEGLVRNLHHRDPARRRMAVDLLAEIDAKEFSPEIAQLVTDEDWLVRTSVACALLRWGGPQEALEKLADDPDVIVRGCARWYA